MPIALVVLAACLDLQHNRVCLRRLPAPQVNVQNVHRFFQANTQRFGAGGMWRLRLLHQRCAGVLCCRRRVLPATLAALIQAEPICLSLRCRLWGLSRPPSYSASPLQGCGAV